MGSQDELFGTAVVDDARRPTHVDGVDVTTSITWRRVAPRSTSVDRG